jgi:hypothetical protein
VLIFVSCDCSSASNWYRLPPSHYCRSFHRSASLLVLAALQWSTNVLVPSGGVGHTRRHIPKHVRCRACRKPAGGRRRCLFFQGFFSPHAPNESGTEDWTGGLKSTMRWSSPAIRGRLQFHRAFQSGLVLGLFSSTVMAMEIIGAQGVRRALQWSVRKRGRPG